MTNRVREIERRISNLSEGQVAALQSERDVPKRLVDDNEDVSKAA